MITSCARKFFAAMTSADCKRYVRHVIHARRAKRQQPRHTHDAEPNATNAKPNDRTPHAPNTERMTPRRTPRGTTVHLTPPHWHTHDRNYANYQNLQNRQIVTSRANREKCEKAYNSRPISQAHSNNACIFQQTSGKLRFRFGISTSIGVYCSEKPLYLYNF